MPQWNGFNGIETYSYGWFRACDAVNGNLFFCTHPEYSYLLAFRTASHPTSQGKRWRHGAPGRTRLRRNSGPSIRTRSCRKCGHIRGRGSARSGGRCGTQLTQEKLC